MGGKRTFSWPKSWPMDKRPAPFSACRFRHVWRMMKAVIAEQRGHYDRALQLLDEAAEVMPLRSSDRVYRAMLLLRAQHTREAHQAFVALREELKGSDDPDLRYLRHYCTYQLSSLTPGSGQWGYEAKQAKLIDCRASLKGRFPMTTVDEIHERIKPRP
jgi:hypothetical protein